MLNILGLKFECIIVNNYSYIIQIYYTVIVNNCSGCLLPTTNEDMYLSLL
jgi:hypothetical protein